jgi:hypothetical protein
VRLFIKQIIRYLDMAEQGESVGEGVDFGSEITAAQREMEQEKMEQMQPRWDS